MKDYKIYFGCFSDKQPALRINDKDWLAHSHHNVSEWNVMCYGVLLYKWASTIKIQLNLLAKYKKDIII